jgi:hypothetical protein
MGRLALEEQDEARTRKSKSFRLADLNCGSLEVLKLPPADLASTLLKSKSVKSYCIASECATVCMCTYTYETFSRLAFVCL